MENQSSQLNQSSTESLGSLSSSRAISSSLQSHKSRQKKSSLSSFLNSVSDKNNALATTQTHSKSISDELVLYRSLAMKEVQQTIDTESNPDVSRFW